MGDVASGIREAVRALRNIQKRAPVEPAYKGRLRDDGGADDDAKSGINLERALWSEWVVCGSGYERLGSFVGVFGEAGCDASRGGDLWLAP